MEVEDEVTVLIVASDETMLNKVCIEADNEDLFLLYQSDENQKMMDHVQSMDKYGQNIHVEDSLATYYCEYLEDEMLAEIDPNNEPNNSNIPDIGNESSILNIEKYQNIFHCDRVSKSWKSLSLVKQLRQEYEELMEDEELLVSTLEQVMEIVENPPLPKDFYVMNGVMLECVFCGVMSESIPTASRHYQEKHGLKSLACYACGLDIKSITSLYKHEKRCTVADASVVLKARAAYLNRKKDSYNGRVLRNEFRYPCTQCSAVFKTRYNLESHVNLHRGERPYRCHVCPSAYTSYAGLYRHMKNHSDFQFICEHCGRSFKIKATFVAHMDTHRPLRKYACLECERRYAQKSALQLHVDRVHRNLPPPCACHLCPRRYPRMSLLKEHMKRAHDMTLITRKMFLKSLPRMTDMEVASSNLVLNSVNEVSEYESNYVEIN